MRKQSPWPDIDAWIDVPDVFLGAHAQRRDQTIDAAERYNSSTITSFAVALALLDDWSIPGLNGNPDKWDFTQLDLRLIGWVIGEVLVPFNACFEVPKN